MLSISSEFWSSFFLHFTLTFFPICPLQTSGLSTFQALPCSSMKVASPLCFVQLASQLALPASCFTHFWSQMVPFIWDALLLSPAERNVLSPKTRTIKTAIRFICLFSLGRNPQY